MKSDSVYRSEIFTNPWRMITGGIWMVLGRFGAALSGVVLVAFLSRLLSKSELAAYFLINSIVLIFSSIAQGGMNLTVVKFVGEQIALNKYSDARSTIDHTIIIVLLYGCIATVIYVIFGANEIGNLFSVPYIKELALPVGILILIRTWQIIAAELFRSLNDIRFASIFGGITTNLTGLSAALLIYAFGVKIDIFIVIYMWIVLSSIIGLLSLSLLKKTLSSQGLKRGESSLTIRKLLISSWPIWLTNVAVLAVARSDLWIVGAFATNMEIALYGGAAQLVLVMAMPASIVNGVLSPMIPTLKALDKHDELENIIRAVTSLSAYLTLIVAIIFWNFGDKILGFIYGSEFEDARSILTILAFGQAIASWVGSSGYTLVLCGFQMTVMRITFLASILAIGGGLILVKPFGIKGVAISFAIALSFQSLLCAVESYRKIGVRVDASISRLLCVKSINKMIKQGIC